MENMLFVCPERKVKIAGEDIKRIWGNLMQ